jgi:hypothetical protein
MHYNAAAIRSEGVEAGWQSLRQRWRYFDLLRALQGGHAIAQ